MKTKIFFILLFFSFSLAAQDFSFEIQTNPDSTFNLLITEQLSDDRASIEAFYNLDTAALQARLYADINSTYESVASYQRRIDGQLRLRSQLFGALNSVGLNQYATFKRSELDSFYIAPSWKYTNSNSEVLDLTTVYVQGNSTVLRDSTNTNFARVVPQSANHILFRFFPMGSLDVEMYSNDSRRYVGRDDSGVRYVILKRRQ